MLIYFSASTRHLDAKLSTYRKIRDKIRALGHSVSNDWIETEVRRQSGEKIASWGAGNLVADALSSIESCDLLIAEATSASAIGVGYELAYALQRKKPVLALINQGEVDDSYVVGIKHELLTCKIYNDQNLELIIDEFIADNVVNNKDLRFNFVIDRRLHNHLRWRSFRTGKTKAELVRDLLLKDMENQA